MVVNNADKCRSSLRAPWQNGPYKTNTQHDTKTRTTSWRNRHLEKLYFCVFRNKKSVNCIELLNSDFCKTGIFCQNDTQLQIWWHGVACQNTKTLKAYVARWVHCDDRNEPKAELYAQVAQLVEHLTCKQGVVGSIPALGKWLFWAFYKWRSAGPTQVCHGLASGLM